MVTKIRRIIVDIIERKVKHIEFIQSNIARMNQCSFQMKGWMITVVTALLALFAASINEETGIGNTAFIFVAIVPTMIFWILDAYYLQQERKFRGIYNDIVDDLNKNKIKEFAMPLGEYDGCKYCLFHIMFSKTEWPLYLLSIIALLVAGILL